jgi:hypothetical protein
MINVQFNTAMFKKEMDNIVQYSMGYLDGINQGKREFLNNLGQSTSELLRQYLDTSARMNPAMLHHVYEWMQTGSPEARLFDINYTVSNLGLSFKSQFKQSESIKSGSKVPFYDKARVMEGGITVKIKPKPGGVLAFDDNGEEVFTKKPVTIKDPGGPAVEGSYERAFDAFFNNYMRQSFLRSSGVAEYLNNPVLYKQNLSRAKTSGRAAGVATGYRWIANAGVNN